MPTRRTDRQRARRAARAWALAARQ
jgi:hypothetical protein